MPATPPYDAIILAGGQGSRLGGVDKARVDLAGTPLIARPLAACADAERVVVVGPEELRDLFPASSDPRGNEARAARDTVLHTAANRVLVTREDPPGGGPAAATAAGVSLLVDCASGSTLADGASWVVLLSCDLPMAEAGVRRLLQAPTSEAEVRPLPDAPADAETRPALDTTTSEAEAGPLDAPAEAETRPALDTTTAEAEAGPLDAPAEAETRPALDTTTAEAEAGPLDAPAEADPAVDGFCLTDSDGRLQWLFGLYRAASLARAVRDCPQPAGSSMRRLLSGLRLVGIPSTDEISGDLDTWEDHASWTSRLEEMS